MVTYRRALLSEVQDQIEPLAKKHLQETDQRLPEFSKVKVDFESYKHAESVGMFALFVAEEDAKVVGFLSVYIMDTPHIKGFLQGVTDALYVDTSSRKGNIAKTLIQMAEEFVKEMGASYMTLCFKASNPHEKFCDNLGYKADDVMFGKRLEV